MLNKLKKKKLQAHSECYIRDDISLYWKDIYVFWRTHFSILGHMRARKRITEQDGTFLPINKNISVKIRKIYVKGIELKLIECPIAPFLVRGYESHGNNPPKFVELGHRFELSETLITKELFAAVVSDNFAKLCNYNDPQIPMCNLDYASAVIFCDNLSTYFGLEPYYTDTSTMTARSVDYSKKGFRLPSEMEWEYAANALTNTKWSGTNEADLVSQYAVYDPRPEDAEYEKLKPSPIKTKLPNSFGFYDMSGNLSEFCIGKGIKGKGEVFEQRPIVRGGSYEDKIDSVTIFRRANASLTEHMDFVGLRVARTL